LSLGRRWLAGAVGVVVIGALGFGAWDLLLSGSREPDSSGGPLAVRRLTQEQYRQTIAEFFGSDIKVGGRFEPDVRPENGLIADGTSRVAVTPAGFEQYDVLARSIADQVVDKNHRDALIPCKPISSKTPDDSCAGHFLSQIGRLLFRRPLTDDELKTEVEVAHAGAERLNNFYGGLGQSLAGLLDDPNFLFRVEAVNADTHRLDAYSKASRLSFLLWNATPDDELLAAADRGDLDTRKGLARQADRLLASPRIEAGVRAFFSDMLDFETFHDLQKEQSLYPKFSLQAQQDAQEQTLRTIVDLLVTNHGDYRDLFTTRKTFITRALGPIYDVPVTDVTGWQSYEFPEGDPRTGILTQLSFVALHSHPGRSSPTLRGKAVRELLLCERVPAPPNNVDFSVVENTDNPKFRTARDRLTAHRANPTCAGCHAIMDPIGLALEDFDTAGEYRTTENGAPIDASGKLNEVAFKDAAGLGQVLHDDPAVTSCLVRRVYEYGVGRTPEKGEAVWLNDLTRQFSDDGYRIPELLRRIAVSDGFYRVTPSADPLPAAKTASADAPASIATIQPGSH
jgi:hypothetical protein